MECKALIAGLAVGIVGTLIAGLGMSCVLVWDKLALGIVIGLAGIAGAAAAWPLYQRVLRRERAKAADEIMKLSEEAERSLKAYLEWLAQNKDANFANGREMRNLFESALSNQANRLAEMPDITNDELNTMEVADFPEWVSIPGKKTE